jgi:hypothetical protein
MHRVNLRIASPTSGFSCNGLEKASFDVKDMTYVKDDPDAGSFGLLMHACNATRLCTGSSQQTAG